MSKPALPSTTRWEAWQDSPGRAHRALKRKQARASHKVYIVPPEDPRGLAVGGSE